MDVKLSLWGYFVKCVTEKYCCFSGRARRKEFLGFVLFLWITILVFTILTEVAFQGGPMGFLFALVVLCLPALGVYIRRLHDIGRNGWFLLWGMIPLAYLVTGFKMYDLYFRNSQPGANEYGSNPKGE